jgi:hypothetical protein
VKNLLRWLLICVMAAPVAWGAEAPAPVISLRVNGRGAGAEAPLELWRGEPVIVEVVLRAPGKEPIVLEPPDGGWSTRVKFAVTDSAGKGATWPLAVTGKSSTGALALQPNAITTLVLRLAPAASEALARGNYSLVGKLDLTDGKGWRGTVASERITVQVVEPPASPGDALLGRRQLLRVNDALLAGETDRAEAAMKEMLRADAARPEGFVAMALIAEAKGERDLALTAIDQAIARAASPAGAPAERPLPGATAPAKPPTPTKPAPAPSDREISAPAATAAPPKPRSVPLEYYDLRRRFERMPSADAGQK